MNENRLKLCDIRDAWDGVKPMLDSLRELYGLDWRSEDVYASCVNGDAFLWMCEHGFAIVKLQRNPFKLQNELFVWVCVSNHGNGLEEYYPDLCMIAEQANAKVIKFMSPRPGFFKVAKEKGWSAMTEYTIRI